MQLSGFKAPAPLGLSSTCRSQILKCTPHHFLLVIILALAPIFRFCEQPEQIAPDAREKCSSDIPGIHFSVDSIYIDSVINLKSSNHD